MTLTTDLDHLYSALDKTPTDRTLLLAIADEEMERGSDLGPGLQALAACERIPWWWKGWKHWGWIIQGDSCCNEWGTECWLPKSWFEAVSEFDMGVGWAKGWRGKENQGASVAFKVAARAFLKLPQSRQEQLLKGDLNEGC